MDRYLRMDVEEAVRRLRAMADPRRVEGMARYGICSENTLGISVTDLRVMAKEIGKDHQLALMLWETGIHEGRILAAIIDEPERVTRGQMERWAGDFDSWDVCDQACTCLFDRTPYAFEMAAAWSHREEEFVKRAAFALMAGLAVHDRAASDGQFVEMLEHVRRESQDDRRYVKKAVNWALRQIGKRNENLNRMALECATEISDIDSRAARWIASDALRELRSEAVQKRLVSRRPGARPARCQRS